MARKKKTEEERQAVKAKMLAAAEKLVIQEGFSGLSMRKISGLAGYTEGSIYNYFQDKDELLSQLLFQRFKRLTKGVEEPLAATKPLVDQLIDRFVLLTQRAMDMPDLYQRALLSQNPQVKEMTRILKPSHPASPSGPMGRLTSSLKTAMESGQIISSDPQKLAQLLWTAHFGLTLKIILEGLEDKERAEELVRCQMQALFLGLSRL